MFSSVPPDDLTPKEGLALKKEAIKCALLTYADNHDDFYNAMVKAGILYLLDTVITDEIVSPDPATFTPTSAEKENVEKASLYQA